MFERFATSQLFNMLSRRFRREFMKLYIERNYGSVEEIVNDLVANEASLDINVLIDNLDLNIDWIEGIIRHKEANLCVVTRNRRRIVERIVNV